MRTTKLNRKKRVLENRRPRREIQAMKPSTIAGIAALALGAVMLVAHFVMGYGSLTGGAVVAGAGLLALFASKCGT